jgi:hypothetical protein
MSIDCEKPMKLMLLLLLDGARKIIFATVKRLVVQET